MNKLQELENEFRNKNPSKAMEYTYPNFDFSEVQLDGWFTSDRFRQIANDLDEFNKRAE